MENIPIVLMIVILIGASIFLEKIFNKPREKYNWDKPPKFYFYISMFIPVVGFIIWCVFVNHKPNSAKSAGSGALCNILLSIIIVLSVWLLGILFHL